MSNRPPKEYRPLLDTRRGTYLVGAIYALSVLAVPAIAVVLLLWFYGVL